MKRIYGFLLLCCFVVVHQVSATTAYTCNIAHALQLSPQAEISLITCSPSEDEVFTVYGHTALRVNDTVQKIDRIYNYGTFDFSKPNFIYRFAKGETDYRLEASHFSYFLVAYISRGSEIYEQVLNLHQEEKEAIWQALEWNVLPENRVYRYNFFFDNCATRPVDMIENNIQGFVKYAPPTTDLPSFRDVINYCTRYRPWQTFGCDIVLGLPTDRTMTQRETLFSRDYVKNAYNKVEIIREGKSDPLVKKVNILAEEDQPPPNFGYGRSSIQLLTLLSPLFCFSALFILLLALTYNEWRKKKVYRIVDGILFFCAGIAGCIVFFLCFLSVHPCIFPNINLLWLHPLHLTGIIFFAVKKWKMMAYWYHLINFAVIIILIAGWIFIPQHLNSAFIPLIASLWLRSGWALVRKKYMIG